MSAGPLYLTDISTCLVNSVALGAVESISISEQPQKLRLRNNGVVDGAVGLPTVDSVKTITITTQDAGAKALSLGDSPIAISFTGKAALNTIYTAGSDVSVSCSGCVATGRSDGFNQKREATFTVTYEILSGGTITYA